MNSASCPASVMLSLLACRSWRFCCRSRWPGCSLRRSMVRSDRALSSPDLRRGDALRTAALGQNKERVTSAPASVPQCGHVCMAAPRRLPARSRSLRACARCVSERRQLASAGVVLVLGASDWQRTMLRAELVRLCPQLDPGAKSSRRGGRKARQPAGDAGMTSSAFEMCGPADCEAHGSHWPPIKSGCVCFVTSASRPKATAVHFHKPALPCVRLRGVSASN